jgi:hypothetical protein
VTGKRRIFQEDSNYNSKMTRTKSKKPGFQWRLFQCLPIIILFFIVSFNLFVLTLRMYHPKSMNIPSSRQYTIKEDNRGIHDIRTAESSKREQTKESWEKPIATVAHVVSLIQCSESVIGFLDAAAIFRHSIHKQSFWAGGGVSKYDYQMYAIIHETCRNHGNLLQRLGYTVLIKPSPIQLDEIQGLWYKQHVEGENCCGSAEFIKLYAYTLTNHPIVVHWDMDVAVLAPMDDLFDAMIYPKDSIEGIAARGRLERQHPNEVLPDSIDAFFTRDITSAQPWEQHQGVQGGFLVVRPSLEVLQQYLNFIRLGNYTPGRGEGSGWNGLGYGGFQGAMAYQGAVAFYYDHFRPNTAVELAVCRWNQVVADVVWRGPRWMKKYHMQCRQYPKDGNFEANTNCEDCRITPIDQVKTVHFTACNKPWECMLPYPPAPRFKQEGYRLSQLTNITTCGLLFRKWFELRKDLELQLQRYNVAPSKNEGSFHQEYFLGHCSSNKNYIPMNPPPDGFDMKQIYGL